MSQQNPFALYEYVGVVAPGAVFIVTMELLHPFLPFELSADTSLGSFGVLVIVAFVVGHLLQAVGRLVEMVLWKLCGGMPSTWPFTGRHPLLAENQTQILRTKVSSLHPNLSQNWQLSERESFMIGRQIYAILETEKRTNRVDMFNRTYGLLRGTSAAFLLNGVFAVVLFKPDIVAILCAAALLSIQQMHHYGVSYGRELMVQYVAFEQKAEK